MRAPDLLRVHDARAGRVALPRALGKAAGCPEGNGRRRAGRDEAAARARYPVTMVLIAMNVGIFLLELAMGGNADGTSNKIFNQGALLANGVTRMASSTGSTVVRAGTQGVANGELVAADHLGVPARRPDPPGPQHARRSTGSAACSSSVIGSLRFAASLRRLRPRRRGRGAAISARTCRPSARRARSSASSARSSCSSAEARSRAAARSSP